MTSVVREIRNLSAESAIELLVEEFPWLRLMSEDARAAFAKEFELRLRTSADLGEWSTLDQFLTEWKDTARSVAVRVGHPKETE